jgi:methylmalonyl-CoA/ethylmalonyl-CoA epimerase
VIELPIGLTLPAGYEFHHIGYATESIIREQDFFAFLGYHQEGENFVDSGQGVEGCFLTGPGPRIELLKNLTGYETLTPWLNAGIKMYHIAYIVDNMEETLNWSRNQRTRITVPPVKAAAFGGKRISFVMFRHGLMLEFITK